MLRVNVPESEEQKCLRKIPNGMKDDSRRSRQRKNGVCWQKRSQRVSEYEPEAEERQKLMSRKPSIRLSRMKEASRKITGVGRKKRKKRRCEDEKEVRQAVSNIATSYDASR
ncbi:hypothetical protein B9Z55_011246 [Caenorhabditis nigoni]|uniref:Uncharacterized protein n=1 Tax=Caenorhabditis nigoni TaxID=1611254 RepID=A0A2G5UK46_9PELO|nr:hypothetical protein B9Z55_011246 [Caenorhabditis nigoni]